MGLEIWVSVGHLLSLCMVPRSISKIQKNKNQNKAKKTWRMHTGSLQVLHHSMISYPVPTEGLDVFTQGS